MNVILPEKNPIKSLVVFKYKSLKCSFNVFKTSKLRFFSCFKVVIKDKVLELLLYFTRIEDEEEVQTKAIMGLGERLSLSSVIVSTTAYMAVGFFSVDVKTCHKMPIRWKALF